MWFPHPTELQLSSSSHFHIAVGRSLGRRRSQRERIVAQVRSDALDLALLVAVLGVASEEPAEIGEAVQVAQDFRVQIPSLFLRSSVRRVRPAAARADMNRRRPSLFSPVDLKLDGFKPSSPLRGIHPSVPHPLHAGCYT